MKRILVTGFGPFPGVDDNPSARLVRAVDGSRQGDAVVYGRVLDVSFRRAPDATVDVATRLPADLVLGFGVAVGRPTVQVERWAVRAPAGRPDVDGSLDSLLEGPDRVAATLPTARLASALGADVSEDAGRYVCNAWLYRVASALRVPVGFVHVPAAGMKPERLLDALSDFLG